MKNIQKGRTTLVSSLHIPSRYMLFVQHSKNITPNNSSYQSANDKIDPFADNSDLSSMVMLTESIKGHDERVTNTKKTPLKDVTSETCHRNQSNQPLPFSIPSQETDLFWKDDLLGCQNDDSENFFCLKGKKREKQSESGRSRRRTLSPTTSRNMLLEVLESEEIEVSSSKSDVSTDLSKELVPSGFVPLELPILPQVEESFPQISPTTVNKKAEIPVTKRIKEFALSSTKDDQYNQEALKRFKIRQEIARWKYTWEIVSNEAAMTALQYILKISEE